MPAKTGVKRGAARNSASRVKTSKNITIRMPVHDIERARRLADQKGFGYRTDMKMFLHEAPHREESAPNPGARRPRAGTRG